MAVARSSRKNRQNDLWPECAYHFHHIIQQRILWPVLVRLFSTLGKSKVVSACKILMRTVDATRCKKLLAPDYTECFAELISNQILPAVTAREREVRRLGVSSTLQPRYELTVFVVRV